jgi:ATP-dependent helicase/nuclease subunit A
VRDESLNARYTTLPHEVVKLETEKSALSEEMRVLYVAMTRAKEKLICVMTLSNPAQTAKKAAGFLKQNVQKLDPLGVSQASGFGEWLLACALRHPDSGGLRRMAGLEENEIIPCESRWEVAVEEAKAADELGGSEDGQTDGFSADPALIAEITSRTSFIYPFRELSRVPSKVAVSEIAEAENRSEWAGRFEGGRPAFMEGDSLTPAQKGTALHAFMQYARLDNIGCREDVQAEIERLVGERFILSSAGAAVDIDRVMRYLGSELFRRIKSAKRVLREFRFNICAGSGEFKDIGPEGETVVLQGIADVVFEDEGGLCILDYKTDNAGAQQLRERYTKQLEIYAEAVSQVMERKVTSKFIYGFKDGIVVSI